MTVTEVVLHLLNFAPPSPSRHALLLLHARNRIFHLHCRPISISDSRILLLFQQRSSHVCRSRRWDSNAESYTSKNLKSDAEEEIEDFEDEKEEWIDALEDYIDSIWIFKVFGSYGWMLPPIILSLLLANGPKAFLMALALPLGQSTFAFAIQRLQNWGKNKPKQRKKKARKRRPRFYSSRDDGFDESPEFASSKGARKKQEGYQSWVSKDDFADSSNAETASDLGGWDDLDTGIDYNVRSSRRKSRKPSGLGGRSAHKGEKRRLSESEGPLLLRLLISIFPFLSSWTKML